MEVFETEPQARAGGIWIGLISHSVKFEVKDGGDWAYGGDYGPKGMPSFGNFCCNGLVNALREPHPHLAEVKRCTKISRAVWLMRIN